MKMTYRIAHLLGMDAANQQMQKNGRTVWSKEDYNLAAAALNRHFPLCAELPGIEPERCGCSKCVPAELNQQLVLNIQ
ncbi:MAG: hypothetical protein ACRYGF_08825 [Janthinobacterium lividum]